jgi:hypothetical protein
VKKCPPLLIEVEKWAYITTMSAAGPDLVDIFDGANDEDELIFISYRVKCIAGS